ncbi:MarR family winged helix-turn-helix transcriptional regulator [Arthrobacter sp. NIO-1057]|uniref:MarR family winged helix-turn-helix transcriptional regulator n=1 Tax=Arthrobacter sp. NIO-1057 TaxID=993071 RepID=UPI000817FD71|nr:MarR family transcriptional regulator [Arthrobacter sp. NIO-1057]SCB74596.1 DNA-binding transcriptional regulator, MarR family [Arthrobacter sp. NIO-1057]
MAIVDEMVCFALYSASRATTRAYTELLSPWQLTYTQYLVLVVLWNEGSKPVREIGEMLQLDSGTLSPLLRRLENKEFIRRERSQNDTRVVNVELTEQGSALRKELAHVPEQIACGTGLLDIQSAREYLDTLHQITEQMQKLPIKIQPTN